MANTLKSKIVFILLIAVAVFYSLFISMQSTSGLTYAAFMGIALIVFIKPYLDKKTMFVGTIISETELPLLRRIAFLFGLLFYFYSLFRVFKT